jgi:hypothetical protein
LKSHLKFIADKGETRQYAFDTVSTKMCRCITGSMLSTLASPVCKKRMTVSDEAENRAVSVGAPVGIQLNAVFHSSVAGWVFHVDVVIYSSRVGVRF